MQPRVSGVRVQDYHVTNEASPLHVPFRTLSLQQPREVYNSVPHSTHIGVMSLSTLFIRAQNVECRNLIRSTMYTSARPLSHLDAK